LVTALAFSSLHLMGFTYAFFAREIPPLIQLSVAAGAILASPCG
jgi:hypothetical protein